MKGHAVLTSSEKMDWGTPWWLYDLLDAEFHFELDAAASPTNAKHERFYTEEDDALIQEWAASTYLNSPYGRAIGSWMKKAKSEAAKGRTVVCLVPVRTDARWWFDNVVDGATEVRLIKGRIQFEGAESGATFPSAVVIYTPNPPPDGPRMRPWDAKAEAKERGMIMAKRKTVSTKKSKTDPVSINEEGVESAETEAETEAKALAAAAATAVLAAVDDPFGFGAPAAAPSAASVQVTTQLSANGNGHTVGSNLIGTPIGLGAVQVGFSPAASSAPTVGGIQVTPTSAPLARIEPFTSMSANLKGLSGDVALAPLMAVCGGNRRGKTATRIGFELALTGKAPGCVHAQDYMEYASPGADGISSMLISPSGSAHFEVNDGKKPPERPEYFGALKMLDSAEVRERVLPSATMKSFLVGDVKARRAIFQRFGAGVVPQNGVPTPKGLNTDQSLFWRTTVEEIATKTGDAAEILSEMNRVMASKKLALGKEATSAEKQLKEAQARLAEAAAGAEIIPALEEQYKQAIAYENLESTRRQLQMAEQEFQRLDVEAQEFLQQDSALGQFAANFAQLEQVVLGGIQDATAERQKFADEAALLAPKLKRVAAIDEILTAMVQASIHACPVCDSQADPAALKTKIAGILQERMTGHEQLLARIRTIDENITQLNGRLANEKAAYDRAKAQHEQRRATLKGGAATVQARIQAHQQTLAAAPGAIAESSAAIKARIDALRASENVRSLTGQLETTIRQKRNEQAIAKVLEKEAEGLLQGLLRQAASGAETAVNEYMPAGFTAKLDLGDGGCRWTVVGADGRPHGVHTMSGAEQASLLIALALAWTAGSPIRCLTLDDADIGPYHSSPENLQALLAKIEEAVESGALTQAMVCGVRSDEVPAGWLVIQR